MKTTVLLPILFAFSLQASAQVLSAEELKDFRADFLKVNRNIFFDTAELSEKAEDSLHYRILLWHQLANPKSKKSFIDIVAFLAENPDFPKRDVLQKQAEALITDDMDMEMLQEWFLETQPLTVKGIEYYVSFMDEEEVAPYLSQVWSEREFSAAEERHFYTTFSGHLTRDDLIARVDDLLWKGKTANAAELMKYVPKDYRSLFNARIALRRNYRNVTAAIDAVPKALQDDEGLLFERTKWRRRKKLYNEAIALLSSEQSHQTHHEEWWQERVIIVRHLLKQGQYQQAYNLTVTGDNSSELILAENQWLAGWIAYRFLDRPDTALGHFLSMRESVSSSISKARGDYWIARCYGEMHDMPRAWNHYNRAAEHTSTFYGQKAIEEAGINVKNLFKNKPNVSDRYYNRYKETELARSIIFLSDLRLDGLMNSFALRALHTADDDRDVVSLVMLLREIGHDEMAVLVSRRARTKGIDVGAAGYPVLKGVTYPKDADKALLHAIIRQESGFNPNAKSPKGARGLMQIMPSTARNLSQWKKLKYSLQRLTSDRNYNIELGEYFLRRLMRQYGGSYPQVFAAYNGGANNVRKWNAEFARHKVENNKHLDEIDWIENIPFGETRNYVQRVEENYYIYKKLDM